MKYQKTYLALLFILSIGTIFYHFVENFKWLDALYFSVVALTTAGFGDITPVTDLGKVFTMIYMITGFGIMLNFLNAFYENRQEKQKKIKSKIEATKSKLSDNA
jgi:voltage-gated potassium channel Kch